jgi:hypothetical protein
MFMSTSQLIRRTALSVARQQAVTIVHPWYCLKVNPRAFIQDELYAALFGAAEESLPAKPTDFTCWYVEGLVRAVLTTGNSAGDMGTLRGALVAPRNHEGRPNAVLDTEES